MALADQLPQLECGRAVEDVWANAAAPANQHEQHCEYCQQARHNLRRLQQAIQAERSLPPDPQQEPSGRVRAGIMSIVRAEIRHGRRISLEYPPREQPAGNTQTGSLTDDTADAADPELAITEYALAEVIRSAADDIIELRARRIRLTPSPQRSGPQAEPVSVQVAISVSASASSSIPELAELLRERITVAVAEQVGLSISRVDVAVEDVHDAWAS